MASPISLSLLGRFGEEHIAAVSDMLCTLTRVVDRQEAGLSFFFFFFLFFFFFYGGVCSGPTVARAVVQWQC